MAEYIDRELAIKAVRNEDKDVMADYGEEYGTEWGFSEEKIIGVIMKVPAADVSPVVHAKWGEYEAFTLTPSMNGYPCGNCGMHFSASVVPILNFCPNCGAEMDAE